MIQLSRLIAEIEAFAPTALAEDFDNVGLLVGAQEKEISSVLVCLDFDEYVVAEAAEKGAQLILSHHPAMFTPIKKITAENGHDKALLALIKKDIALYTAHTNIDILSGGLCDRLLKIIGLPTSEKPISETGIGRVVGLDGMKLGEIISNIKKSLHMANIRFVGDAERKIKSFAICNGGGPDYIYDAQKLGCDLYISGDFKYHHARFAYENNMALIEIPHYNAEICFIALMAEFLEKKLENEIQVIKSHANIDIWRNSIELDRG